VQSDARIALREKVYPLVCKLCCPLLFLFCYGLKYKGKYLTNVTNVYHCINNKRSFFLLCMHHMEISFQSLSLLFHCEIMNGSYWIWEMLDSTISFTMCGLSGNLKIRSCTKRTLLFVDFVLSILKKF